MRMESHGGMILGRKTEELGEMPAQVPLFRLNVCHFRAFAGTGLRYMALRPSSMHDLPTEFHKVYQLVEKLLGGTAICHTRYRFSSSSYES
jgi:hypothetical protein